MKIKPHQTLMISQYQKKLKSTKTIENEML